MHPLGSVSITLRAHNIFKGSQNILISFKIKRKEMNFYVKYCDEILCLYQQS